MFNLLMSANDRAWENGHWTLERARFLEYTDANLQSKLEALDDAAMIKLKEIPTLFAYEKSVEQPFRLGRILEIRADRRNVSIDFTLYPDLAAAPKSFQQLRAQLGVTEDFELHRTHWAVKNIDIFSTGLFKVGAKLDIFGSRIFIVHGHDHEMKTEVFDLLEQFGLEPVVLHLEPNKGRTIIEKFEQTADVGFAVILLTGDDVIKGGVRRARQNVILELGYFIGRLGRNRVCALKKGQVEVPSDILGVAFTDVKPDGEWKNELYRELQAADYTLRRLAKL